MSSDETSTYQEESKEGFCGACIAAPLAMVGAGASVYGASSKKKHKNTKKIILWVGISVTVLSVLIVIYYLWIKKCSDCE